jgi:hypothetical protein
MLQAPWPGRAKLTALGVENPRPLLEAVQQWGTVNIHERADAAPR